MCAIGHGGEHGEVLHARAAARLERAGLAELPEGTRERLGPHAEHVREHRQGHRQRLVLRLALEGNEEARHATQ